MNDEMINDVIENKIKRAEPFWCGVEIINRYITDAIPLTTDRLEEVYGFLKYCRVNGMTALPLYEKSIEMLKNYESR